MSVPFQDLARLHASIRAELDEAIQAVIASSSFIGGQSKDFATAFAHAHGAAAGSGCGSGTDALVLALRALGVGSGDEVIVPAMTFVATAEAVVLAGATPVIADVDPRTLLLTATTVEERRTPRTRAVIPVHLYGSMVAADDLVAMRDMGLLVVEDAAQAHLASNARGHAGSIGHCACFSFYPGKNLGAFGDGGAVISNDDELIERVRTLADHGRRQKHVHDEVGYCSRLDGLQAAILQVKMRHLPEWTEARRRIAATYLHRLGDLLVPWDVGAVHHLIVSRIGQRRDAIAERLHTAGIATGIHYPVALSEQPSMAAWCHPCPVAEDAARSILSLPIDPLMTDGDVEQVCSALLDAVSG